MNENQTDGSKKRIVLLIIILLLTALIISRIILKQPKKTTKQTESNNNTQEVIDKNKKETKEETKEEKKPKVTEEKKLEFTYEIEEYKVSTKDKKLNIKSSRNTIIETSNKVINKAINSINNIVDGYWKELKEMMDEQVSDAEEYSTSEATYGVDYKISDYYNDKIITFTITTSGSMGGVSWNDIEGYNYSRATGESLTLKDICNNPSKCKEAIFDYFLSELKKDERYPNLYDNYKETIKEALFEEGNYFFNDEGLELVIPKYEISDGGNGIFTYNMAYNKINEYLKEEYK